MVEGSEAVSTKLWRWQEALEAIGSSGGGRRLGGSKHEALEVVEGSEAASTELWRRPEGCCGGSRKLWRHQGALEGVARSGGGSETWRHMLPIAYSSPTRCCLPFTSCPPSTSYSTSCLPSTRDLALTHHPSYACYPARHRGAWVSPFPLEYACGGGLEVWRCSEGLEEVSEVPEEVEGSEVVSTKLWRRSKARRQQARSFGGSRMLWRWSNTMEEIRGSRGVRRLRRQ